MESANRKLIRPSLNEIKEQIAPPRRAQKKPVPPDQTNAENFYYVKQMQSKTPMVFVLKDGETLHGVIEWYDKCCLKVNRNGEPNLLLYKPNIKYMYKAWPGRPIPRGDFVRRAGRFAFHRLLCSDAFLLPSQELPAG